MGIGLIEPTASQAGLQRRLQLRHRVAVEALDRICADLDVQIGLTVLKAGPATISGTRLRGVAEAAGFRLTDSGRFDGSTRCGPHPSGAGNGSRFRAGTDEVAERTVKLLRACVPAAVRAAPRTDSAGPSSSSATEPTCRS